MMIVRYGSCTVEVGLRRNAGVTETRFSLGLGETVVEGLFGGPESVQQAYFTLMMNGLITEQQGRDFAVVFNQAFPTEKGWQLSAEDGTAPTVEKKRGLDLFSFYRHHAPIMIAEE